MATRSPVVCRYYERGICRFGEMCRFQHPNEIPTNADETRLDAEAIAAATIVAGSTSSNAQNKNEIQNNWAMAPVFVPKSHNINNVPASHSGQNIENVGGAGHSYAEIAGGSTPGSSNPINVTKNNSFCPYELGCPYGVYCNYQHNDQCDMCGRYCLHPTDKTLRKKHINECVQQHEKDMELSFAIARSQNKTCGICFDIIMEKNGRQKRFGILPNCNHIFCLECIRKWRQAKQFENKVTRSCPECRISSDFVCPSAFWVESKEDKDKLITEYKSALGDKDCVYFNKGKGKCPFGNKCFYKHALPNGVKVDVGVPQKRKVYHHLGLMDLFSDISVYEFINHRDLPISWLEFMSNFEDSDDSDWSDEMD